MLYHWATGTLANIFNMNNIFIFNNILNAIFSGLHCRNDSNILQSVIAISKALLTFDSNEMDNVLLTDSLLTCRYLLYCITYCAILVAQQENCKNDEILLSLKYVRPGNGFEPKFQLLEKLEVNGENAHPLFVFLKETLPQPSDDSVSLMGDPKCIIWSPVNRNDVSWNFEKFLIGPDGEPFKRYSRRFLTIDIEADIKELLKRMK